MPSAPQRPSSSSDETEHERLNRELDQLLGELRIALPGVQVLLAFLLTAPFTDGFATVRHESRVVFVGAIGLAAVASILLIAPTVHHRVRFRDGTKEEMIRTANRFAVVGAACLGLAIGCATYVVGDSAFPATPTRWLGPALVLLAAGTWFGVPRSYRSRRDRHPKGRLTGRPGPGRVGPDVQPRGSSTEDRGGPA